ncbi:DUF6236 family protein [Streptomyces sp. NPDC048219]|uniref:DUF6236 family protein n=1 Tax=unclassified Streptomyces TaxID=2593676 RepID=UPI0034250F81
MSIGLYYPYVHFRDLAWIKAAALFMPRLARIVPQGFRVSDPDDVRALRDGLGFVEDFDPADAVETVSQHMLHLIDRRGDDLRRRFDVCDGVVAHLVNAEPSPPGTPAPMYGTYHRFTSDGRPLAGLFPGEMTETLRGVLQANGLARPVVRNAVGGQSGPEWVGLDPALAWVYKCALTSELANRASFTPLTDQVAAHTASGTWNADRMAAVLLSEATASAREHEDLTARVGVLSVRYVLPARLEAVPVDKIVELRTRYEAEFRAFSDSVERTASTLRDSVGDIENRRALEMHLRDAVHRDFEIQVDELRKMMNGIGLQTITTAAGTNFEIPTSMALVSATTGVAVGSTMGTLTGAAGTAAVAAFGIVTGARRRANDAVSANPAGFLLRVERGLRPVTLWERVNRALRRSVGAGI